jgi:hypothetical protein
VYPCRSWCSSRRSAAALVAATLAGLVLSSCASGSPDNATGRLASGVARVDTPVPIPIPPPPSLVVLASGRHLSETAVNDVPRGHVPLEFTVSPPRGSVVTGFVVGVSSTVPTWEGPGTSVPRAELVLLRRMNLRLATAEKFSETWAWAGAGPAFLGVWFVTNSRNPPDTGQDSRIVFRLVRTSR